MQRLEGRHGGAARILLVGALAAACLAVRDSPARAFPNTQPDASEQWYLGQDNAWSFWATPPRLAPVKVAVIDTGIDAGNPAFAGRIAGGKSFVGGSWGVDSDGHGTFVAGIIAANPFNGIGTAGMAFNAQLLVAKVLPADSDGAIPPATEAAAIRWAADQGARVINLSLGGLRDPNDPELNSYSRVERDAIEYAYAKGAVIVAAVGNGTNAPAQPWNFADYPAALPNVLGVAALAQDGSVPSFSDRDPLYVDLAAPGAGIFSTIPRNLVQSTGDPSCAGNPYSNCGPSEFQTGNGTSFAAPQVAAAAALLLGVDPRLAPDQVMWLLERSATDMTPANGCSGCGAGRDSLTGWGRLDVARALSWLKQGVALPAPDMLEPDDDTGSEAHAVGALPASLASSLDYWDDPVDVFSVVLHAGERLVATVSSPSVEPLSLRLLKPGTPDLEVAGSGSVIASSQPAGRDPALDVEISTSGRYYLELSERKGSRARAAYRLNLSTTAAAATQG